MFARRRVLVFATAALMLAACGVPASPTTSQLPAGTAGPAQVVPVASHGPAGDPPTSAGVVTVGATRWRIVGVQHLGPTIQSETRVTDDATADGTFIVVTFAIETTGVAPTDFPRTHGELVDSTGRVYPSTDNAAALAALGDQYGDHCRAQQFEAGSLYECIVVYDVPAAAKITGVQAGDINNARDTNHQTLPLPTFR